MPAAPATSSRTRSTPRSPASAAGSTAASPSWTKSGSKENRRKRLMVMDQDGANVRALTNGENAVVAPRYSPATQDIAFMTQATGQQPRIQVINLETGSRQALGKCRFDEHQPALLARRPPPRDERAAGRQRRHRTSWTSASKAQTPITNGNAIDTSPTYSPDGSQIVFESDRGGSQQIYVMGAWTARTHAASPSARARPRSRPGRRAATSSPSPASARAASPSA